MVIPFGNLGRAISKTASSLGTLTKAVATNGNTFNTFLQSAQRDLNVVSNQANPSSNFFESSNQVLNDPLRKIIDNFSASGITGGAVLGSPQVAENITQLVGSSNRSNKDITEIGDALKKIPNGTKALGAALDLLGTATKLNPTSFLANPSLNKLQTAAKTLGTLTSTVSSISALTSGKNLLPNIGNDLANFFNPISVLTRDNAEIFGLVGGIFEPFKEVLAKSNEASEFFNFFNNVFSGGKIGTNPAPGVDPQTGRQPNPLRYHNTYNYIITLGVLNAEEYNTNSYRNNGKFSKIILRSGGGELNVRQTTSIEDALSIDAEYFIEDLEVDGVIAPNQNTGITLGTTLRFKVIEPYSMGLFIESLIQAALSVGYQNYMQAPFALRIEFAGWDETGQNSAVYVTPKFLPIMITKMDFNVGAEGSNYDVEAVIYSESPLENSINETKTFIGATGVKVHQILETSEGSLTNTLNSRVEDQEKQEKIQGFDRYLIVFPKDKTSLYNAVKGIGGFAPLTFTAEQELSNRIGDSTGSIALENPASRQAEVETINSPPQIYEYLKSWAQEEGNMNAIGLSPIIEDTTDGGAVEFPPVASVYDDAILRGIRRNLPEARVPEKARKAQFNRGSRITQIIEEVCLNSVYIKESATTDDGNGFKRWFRIETMVFIETNDPAQKELGRPRKTYVYSVHPYFVDEAKLIAPNEAPRNTEILKEAVVKEYNYYYTGLNEDVLNFDINFNHAFFSNVLADFARGSDSLSGLTAGVGGNTEYETPKKDSGNQSSNKEPAPVHNQVSYNSFDIGGGFQSSLPYSKKRIAETIHSRIINSPVDMITAEMEIWGDPYYLPTDLGNYSASPLAPTINSEGTMSYITNEVLILVNFRTPVDYAQIGGLMIGFNDVSYFSGLYQVWAVTSIFSGGEFKQQIKLIRRAKQNSNPTGTQGNLVPQSIGYGIGQVDPGLARAAGLVQNRTTLRSTSSATSPVTGTNTANNRNLPRRPGQQTSGISTRPVTNRPPVGPQ